MDAYKAQVSSRKNSINSWNKVPLKAMMNVTKQISEILKSQIAGSQN